jgi:long-chain acyl-CoA synthetase
MGGLSADAEDGDRESGFWRLARLNPDVLAVIDSDGSTTTYGELLERSRRVANGLVGLGVGEADCIAAVLPNHSVFFEVVLAGLELGLYVTPVNSHLAAPEIHQVLVDSEARVVVTHEALRDAAAVVVHGPQDDAMHRFAVGELEGFRPYDELLDTDGAEPRRRSAGQLMPYTSGTTGQPKGVRRPLPAGDPDDVFGRVAIITCRGFGIPTGIGSHLVCGPLYHPGPFVGALNSLQVGKTVVLMQSWTPERFLELIERHNIDSTQMVPTMLNRLLQLPLERREAADLSSLRSVFHTGAPCPTAIKRAILDWWGPVVYETYGGSEGAATIATPHRWLEKPGTVGKPIHGVSLHIVDADGNELAPGEIGDIWIESSAQAPPEYFKDPGKTREMRCGNRFTLGDIGYLDEDGYLFLCDRKIDMVISGGVNIYSAEVEAALIGAPDVADAAVIGVPDADWGESVKAVIELRPGSRACDETVAAILEHCERYIARFKLPRSIDFVHQLPRLPNGKIEKRRLRDPYWVGKKRCI